MNPFMIVIVPKLLELSLEVDRIPEKDVIQELAANGPDQALDEGMGQGHIRDGLDFFDANYAFWIAIQPERQIGGISLDSL